jgi:secondary thiamine-phosphate synthase enzyme
MKGSFSVETRSQTECVDITHRVSQIVRESGVRDGICVVFVPHTTAAVTINENADPSVVADVLMEVNKVIPFRDGYRHGEGNSAAHIKSSLFGASETILIREGDLLLGTWQGLYFAEFDGPRRRRVEVQVVGS